MIYTESELKKKIYKMIEEFESEVVEFKEATSNYSFNDIGKFISVSDVAVLDLYRRLNNNEI